MSTMIRLPVLLLPALLLSHAAAGGASAPAASLWALEIPVSSPERSIAFYEESLGFRVERGPGAESGATLRNGEGRLALRRSPSPQAGRGAARAYLNMSVGDLETALSRALAAGGRIDEKKVKESAVGPYLEIFDPDGNLIHLIDHPWDEMAADDPPAVFNIGVHVRSIAEAEPFFARLGFVVSTRDYLPRTLVYERRGVSYIVLHPDAEGPSSPGEAAGGLVVSVADPSGLASTMEGSPGAEIRSPSGVPVRLVSPQEPGER